MSRRNPTNGAAGMQEIMAGAMMPPPEPPINLSANERVYWDKLFKAKARRGWLEQDYYMLVDACRVRHEIETLQNRIKEVDPVENSITYARLSKLIDQGVRRFKTISTYLQIHPGATQGKAKDQREQNKIHCEAAGISQHQDDDLIPWAKH